MCTEYNRNTSPLLSDYYSMRASFVKNRGRCLKVPKCEIFDLFDDFYVMKSLSIGDFRDEIKKLIL